MAARRRSLAHPLLLLAIALCCMQCVESLKQKWSFTEETRRQFLIERFGFDVGGHMDVQVDIPLLSQAPRSSLLFVHEDDLVDDAASYFTQPFNEDLCLLDNQTATDRMDFADSTTWHLSHTVVTPGFYYLMFAHCGDTDTSLTFSMEATFLNPNSNYLSSGDAAVPLIYLVTSVVFGAGACVWGRTLQQNSPHIHHIHHMMTGLLLLKVVSTFCEAMRFYYMKHHGDTLTSWNVVFYVFMFVKGMAMFVVILLIGTGWSILKQHLNRTEKNVVFVVLLLQVAINVAVVVLQESSVGTQAWVHWRDAMHVLDILCCCAILFPIVWSIRQLRDTAAVDGKAQINLRKLTQFRGFYVAVVTYVYFTRIALYLLAASVPYTMTWVTVAVAEAAALVFYAYTGRKFKPQTAHPYLALHTQVDLVRRIAFWRVMTARRTNLAWTTMKCLT
ncbi:hypothetical protein, variant 1 [Aphanomyces invadans]|uniref:Intimal thickness related receptor IRP domain-containing protein n=1 Tax=Aphanomyces invadans TaxID=157072 RepID=A0A024TIH3_9STRA|nr:hypothetical protein, variant 1 [Aphanomyces invadans]ETV93381.1 hypothetical protein, variant 1 [Aphanomyces invadans]|eukprot:XP_008878017.1 hypothetical protein, variant 1 [Aphanomyces invadans]